ncbi:hypothetical protein OAU50_08255 [Planctomycetota bacterium]|nr:hypothetical protein [Planctomycetota bacterium]
MSLREQVVAAFKGPRQLIFTGDETFFQGHFPERAVLPAFVQLMAVRVALETELDAGLEVTDVSRAVFKRPVEPKQALDLELSIQGVKAKGVIRCDGHEVSIFHFRFRQIEARA